VEGCPALGAEECLDSAEAWLKGPQAVIDDGSDPALLDLACRRKVPDACAWLGRMVQEGRRVPADGPRAAELYRRACEAGRASACSDLGVLYRFGAGVPRDEARAGALFAGACEQGVERACALRDDPSRPID
ncbi:tetratricopeptide repeat protein, partial [Anaeromyxobacter sp. PSR-1]|uniref:tetratricopeptide repeat protein n=1 Tax=Anaeromyxobacter sp. PSR-1 TaxID=1300915 RepID=UPI000A8F7908